MKRNIAVLLVAALLCLAGGAQAADMASIMGYDGETERDWSTSLFFTRLEEQTGVHVAGFQQYRDAAAYAQALDQALAGEAQPDVLFKAMLTPQQELLGAANGTLIDLAPLLAEHAPNLAALLAANPDWRAAITLPDGKIVALPMLGAAERQVVVWLNQAWLTELKLALPTTPEELRAALIAIRDGDPNHNGKKDEIPLLVMGPWEAKWLMGCFGLAGNDYNLFLDETGTVRCTALEPGFEAWLAYMRDLYAEGLLGPEAFRGTNGMLELEEKNYDPPRLGGLVSMAPYSLLDIKHTTQYAAVPPMALAGKTAYRDLLGPVWRGTFAITSACADPAAALRWVDALYTPEGSVLTWAGLEGVDFAYDGNGQWNFLADELRTPAVIQTEALMSGGAALPGLQPGDFWREIALESERHALAQSDTVAKAAALPMPLVYFTAAQQARLDELQAGLGPAVDKGIARLITGEIEINEANLAAFRAELNEAGLPELMTIWQQAVAR